MNGNLLRCMGMMASLALFAAATSNTAWAQEDYKGTPPAIELDFGVLSGLALYGSSAGFGVIGTVAKKIVNQGFVPEINNQVFIELQLGPTFFSGATPFFYSAHLRWDFIKNSSWTLYSLGGLSGLVGDSIGNDWPVRPRVGIGSFWNVSPAVTLRGEVSAELVAAGISFAL